MSGDIQVVVDHYEQTEKDAWCHTVVDAEGKTVEVKGDRTRYPTDKRLAHVDYKQPKYYFGETWYARKLMDLGHVCWQERFMLFVENATKSTYVRDSEEIHTLMGEDRCQQLYDLASRSLLPVRDPDLVSYHPATGRWGFYEIKVLGDTLKLEQLTSLGLLQRVFSPDANVGVVHLLPKGKMSSMQSHLKFSVLLRDK